MSFEFSEELRLYECFEGFKNFAEHHCKYFYLFMRKKKHLFPSVLLVKFLKYSCIEGMHADFQRISLQKPLKRFRPHGHGYVYAVDD